MFILFALALFFYYSMKNNVIKGNDWPRYQHDNRNSGITSEKLEFPLNPSWQYISQHAPNPAWPAPARQDYWHHIPKLAPLITYDRAFHVTTLDNRIYFASSADHKIYCLNAHSGKEIWTFFTNAPNRIAPAISDNKLYFGSDDGCFYCLNAKSGKEIWKYQATTSPRKIMGNERIISTCPIRSGCVVKNDTVFFAAGLFPKQEVYIIALNAKNGVEIWKKKHDSIAPQGYPLILNDEFFIPNSRSRPYSFDLKNGNETKKFSGGAGGDYIALSEKELLFGFNNFAEIKSDDFLTTAFSGHRVISTNDIYYIASDYQLSAINKNDYQNNYNTQLEIEGKLEQATDELEKLRLQLNQSSNSNVNIKKQINNKLDLISRLGAKIDNVVGKGFLWRQSIVRPYSMILTANALIVGEKDIVKAFALNDGKLLWSNEIDGCAYGLTVAKQKLFVSTDAGNIYCFNTKSIKRKNIINKISNKPFNRNKFYEKAANQILAQLEFKKGFCLVLDCNRGELANELILQSDMYIVGIEQDARKVNMLRKKFDCAGLYGKRITIFHGNLRDLAFTDYFANLIVSDKLLTSTRFVESIEDIYRVLRPSGGVAYLGQPLPDVKLSERKIQSWIGNFKKQDFSIEHENGIWFKIRRDKLPESGEWTHLYANTGNTASSNDKLVNDNLVPQWFGKPGPRNMADRHHRAVPPLYKNGIVYIPGFGRLIAADAYNGTLLWEKIIPDFKRLGIFRDAGNMALNDDLLYVALTAQAIALNPNTGQEDMSYVIPQLVPNETHYWGYIGVQGSVLLGSGRKPEASFNSMSWQDDNELWYDYQRSVTSDYVFCLDRFSGKKLWTYKSGIIMNPTITVGNDRIYFLESHHPNALKDADGLLKMEDFLGEQAFIIALDLQTGKLLWKKQLDVSVKRHSIFFSYADGILVIVSARNKDNSVYYDMYGFNANNGKFLWHQEQDNMKAIGGGHGEQHLHPAIVDDKVYAEPFAYNLQTGKPVKDWQLIRNGHGCGTISASENNLFYRAHNPALCNLIEDETTQRINYVNRPGCWINIIPAGGLVLIPEASSGCTCDFPLQTSLAYLPLSRDLDVEIIADSTTKDNYRKVTLKTRSNKGDIYYTLDGSNPDKNSIKYCAPIQLESTKEVKAIAIQQDETGRLSKKLLSVYQSVGCKVVLNTEYNQKYSGGGAQGLTDGKRGTTDIHHSAWQGYDGNDIDAIIDLGELTNIKQITTSFLQNQNAWIFLPSFLEYSISRDNLTFTKVAEINNEIITKTAGANIEEFNKDNLNIEARYIKVKVQNVGICPDWHKGTGGKCHMFIDEIIIN